MQNNNVSHSKPISYFSVRQPLFQLNTHCQSQPDSASVFTKTEASKVRKKEKQIEKLVPNNVNATPVVNKGNFKNLEHFLLDQCKVVKTETKTLDESAIWKKWCDEEIDTSIEYTDDSSETGLLAMEISSITSFDMQTGDKLDPNESVLASSGNPSDFEPRTSNPSHQGYPQMFPELCKQMLDEEQKTLKNLTAEEKAKRLGAELAALYSTGASSSRRWPSQGQVKVSKPIDKPQRLSVYSPKYNVDMDLDTLSSEDVESMNEEEQRRVVNAFYESNPRHRFKESYPFIVEGMFQKDHQKNDLKVYTSRLGTVKIPDTRTPKDMSMDYVYFLAIRPGVFGGFWYDIHPISLTSAKFKTQYDTIINGFAILAHPVGSREQNLQEDRWVCWNDSLGLMNVNKRASLFTMKKQPLWDKQLDIVTFDARYQMGSFAVEKIVALTNEKEKRIHFPQEIFLLTDAVFKELRMNFAVFYSNTIKSEIVIARDRIGNVNESDPYEIVVVPSFDQTKRTQFHALLIVQANFWTRKNLWVRDALSERTDAYRV